jgi:hypothetical protein
MTRQIDYEWTATETRLKASDGTLLAVIRRKREPIFGPKEDYEEFWGIDEIHGELDIKNVRFRSLEAAQYTVLAAYLEALTTSEILN